MKEQKDFSIKGFSEAVFVVNDLQKSKAFYCEVIGWEEVVEESNTSAFNAFWQIENNATVTTCLLQAPASTTGAIRLVEISGIEHSYIRANSQIWDVGGIYDVNTRVKNVHKLARKLHEHHWFGVNEPVEMQFGPFKVYEWLAKSHDGITHALIERLEPALDNDQQTALFSALINASMIIKDHQSELDFFTKILGFEALIHQEDTFDSAKSNVFGMPFELVASTPHVLTLLSADGTRDGTIELASFPELTGNDFSANAAPYNLGITSLRFPIKGMTAFLQHLNAHDIDYIAGGEVELKPYGVVTLIAINSPSGNRFEFFELTDK
ncbi:Glyoxalase/Bleomycin resistance protein/Dioxygenase superfamily protein [Colwellia chukchiensis]|uniref:Glyoxalase/Bleomycin resistance protein/Dioxygenase superfamily protein n=1 Tax=Colwellia chukchiensis TaxID=641665 RepID=A0A1H7K3U0_9GAMM|nr:VOC family protein [Colwellia chukchiensis]SEK81533.1 Glyoxalase/Bleomycin resistance protein/Dioxygenase superfamily protein [Colwellia chukchiensis]